MRSSVNITITHDPLAADLYATDTAPYSVSAWFTDPADGTIVTAERYGINPVQLIGEVLSDLSQKADDIANLRDPRIATLDDSVEGQLTDEEYVR